MRAPRALLLLKQYVALRKNYCYNGKRIIVGDKTRRIPERKLPMPEKRFVLPAPETVAIPGEAADRLISCGNGRAALLYLFILKNRGAFSEEEAAGALRWTPAAVESAMETLASLGLVAGEGAKAPPARKIPETEPRDELPEYTAADMSRLMGGGGAFPGLVSEVQRRLGKILSSDDLLKLLGIYDGLGLPPEVILILVSYCIGETATKYGGRLPTMRYIEKAAYTWEREGIFSIEEAEEYLKRTEARKSAVGEISAVLQIRGRELTKTERGYVCGWIGMGFSPEVVEAAYDKTVLKTGKLSWGYLNSILKSWHEKGLYTLREIEAREKDFSTAGGAKNPYPGKNAPVGDAPTSESIERLERLLKNIEAQ